jgi:hypothetical protein
VQRRQEGREIRFIDEVSVRRIRHVDIEEQNKNTCQCRRKGCSPWFQPLMVAAGNNGLGRNQREGIERGYRSYRI